jgi:hypothetical protein
MTKALTDNEKLAEAKRLFPNASAEFLVACIESPKALWTRHVNSRVKQGSTRAKAVAQVDREFPGLRGLMLKEANATRRNARV